MFLEERFELIFFFDEDVYNDVHEEDLGAGLLLLQNKTNFKNEWNNKMITWQWKLFHILFWFCSWFYFESMYFHFLQQ